MHKDSIDEFLNYVYLVFRRFKELILVVSYDAQNTIEVFSTNADRKVLIKRTD